MMCCRHERQLNKTPAVAPMRIARMIVADIKFGRFAFVDGITPGALNRFEVRPRGKNNWMLENLAH